MDTNILNTILKLWHPYMPFVTETIWQEVYGADKMLMIETWPKVPLLPRGGSGGVADDFGLLSLPEEMWRSHLELPPSKAVQPAVVGRQAGGH